MLMMFMLLIALMMHAVYGEFPPWNMSTIPSPEIVSLDGIDFSTNSYIDIYKRQRYFRGLNVVVKGPPWHPIIDHYDRRDSFSIHDINYLKYLNINLIRLGIMWPGVEPQRDSYNETYIQLMKKIVQMCRDNGIYVLVDFHQDDLSDKFCGEGVPLWAADSSNAYFPWVHPTRYQFPFPFSLTPFSNYSKDGIPSDAECDLFPWPWYQLTVQGSRAYQNLYDNYNGLRDSWAKYWGKIAKEFNSFDNIIGYDLMNEPFAGDIYRNPLLLLPGIADKVNLQGFYEAASKEIRKYDNKSIIMFEGVTWDNFRLGFTDVPGGDLYRNRTAISYHYYPSGPYLFPIESTFRERIADAKRLKCGLMMTEFDGPSSFVSQWDVIEKADKYLQSWTTWQYKPFIYIYKTGGGDDLLNQTTGLARTDRVRFYSRTFPHAIQGKIILGSLYHNRTDGRFIMKYAADISATRPTEIRVNPEVWYTDGLVVNVYPSSKVMVEYSEKNTHLVILWLTKYCKSGDEISVEIKSKIQ